MISQSATRFICFVMGVSGCGKTTIGRLLAETEALPFFDADDFHPQANKDKMMNGQPLNDSDRAGWLQAINQLAKDHSATGVVIACSALKERYRQQLATGLLLPVHWVYLKGSYEMIRERLLLRKDHYMPAALLQSQFDALEPPDNAIEVEVSQSPEEIIRTLLSKLAGA